MKLVFKEIWAGVGIKARYGLFFGLGLIIGFIPYISTL